MAAALPAADAAGRAPQHLAGAEMTLAIVYKLLTIFTTVGCGFAAARLRALGRDAAAAAGVLAGSAFFVFVPALLFRTMARLDLQALPWHTVAAYFVPTVGFTLLVYALQRRGAARLGAAAPATRAIAAVYGNAVQMGVPMATALFGEAGLAVHVTLVSLHGLVLLTVLTVLVEVDVARSNPRATPLSTVARTARNAAIHPVVLPVLCGLLWNLTGLPLPQVVDDTLVLLATAVAPVCLVLIGVSLAAYGLRGDMRAALASVACKLLALPALVLVVAHWLFGLTGTPLAVLVLMAGMPTGANALIFAQRYRTLEAEATGVIVLSTLAFSVTAALWLAVLARL